MLLNAVELRLVIDNAIKKQYNIKILKVYLAEDNCLGQTVELNFRFCCIRT